MQIPTIQSENGSSTLYVHGEPFFILGGEIHNSAASSLAYMETEVWPNLKDLNMNTVLVPVYWEMIEPVEGQFCFETVDGVIAQARENHMHLVFLWFGLWKNAESMYVPGWMKANTDVYFRAEKRNGEKLNTISPLCEKAVEKDRIAFAEVMRHIREVDEEDSTVILMQVENEIGLLGTERDYSQAAEAAFVREIPGELAQEYGVCGTWRQAFRENAEEYFMAWYFAGAVEKIASAGREAYPLPCYANAWLRQYPWYAGSYPSGGPVKEVHRIWKKAAPSLCTLAPDIYVPYVAQVLDEYGYVGDPLFVPEVRKDAVTASYCLYAFGGCGAMGYSPFGIEELALPPEAIDQPPMEAMLALNIDPSAFDIAGSKEVLARTYGLIGQLKSLCLKYRGTGHMQSFVKKAETDFGAFLRFEDYDLSVAYSPKIPGKPLASGIVFELGKNRFIIAGMMCTLNFRVKPGENARVDYLRLEEGKMTDGEWKAGRILNGDERMSLKLGAMSECVYLELYKY